MRHSAQKPPGRTKLATRRSDAVSSALEMQTRVFGSSQPGHELDPGPYSELGGRITAWVRACRLPLPGPLPSGAVPPGFPQRLGRGPVSLGLAVVACVVAGVLLGALGRCAERDVGPGVGVGAEAELDSATANMVEAFGRLDPDTVKQNASLNATLDGLLQKLRGRGAYVDLVRRFGIDGREDGLLDAALGAPATPAAIDAARLLLQHGEAARFESVLVTTNQAAVVTVLANTGHRAAVPLLSKTVLNETAPVLVRAEAVRGLAQSKEGSLALLEIARSDKLPAALRLPASTELSFSRWPEIKQEGAKVLPPPGLRGGKTLPPIKDLAARKGDPALGADVFKRDTIGCVKCHLAGKEGADFGPNLSEVGTKLAREALFEAILDPSAGVSFGFETWSVETKDGEELIGILAGETPQELSLKTQAGVVQRVRVADIAKREKRAVSLMPTGLQEAMSEEDLVNLIEFLTSLRKPGTEPAKPNP